MCSEWRSRFTSGFPPRSKESGSRSSRSVSSPTATAICISSPSSRRTLTRVFPERFRLSRAPSVAKLVEDARQHKFDQLLVYKLDRLGRETRLILNAVAELEKLGVRVRSMTEEFDTATATGRLMLTMLSGFAAHEREVIRERSVEGTPTGLPPRACGLAGLFPTAIAKRAGRIVISDEKLPGFEMSEADVVRTIYRMSGVERKSCQIIADHLNRTVPAFRAASVARTSETETGKRTRRTAPIWRPSHIRNMIVSRTYMGQHCFGKRTKNRNRKVIVRDVPAIVSPDVWEAAQEVLKSEPDHGKPEQSPALPFARPDQVRALRADRSPACA